MNIKLVSLILRNFKGVKEFDFRPNGKESDILGDNASGKTTMFDAFTWLLFDKDSTDKKDFNIKTIDESGNIIHGLEHEVEGVLEVDGTNITLKKIYKEKWTKRRGEAEKQLTGHTTDYFIDEVPVKKKEYTDKINELIDENIFKLITNPLYFNTVLNWKDRRSILLEVVGDIEDTDVITSNRELEKLKDLLGDKDIEDFKKMIASRKKKLNDEIKSIPYRIDELNRSIEDTEDVEIDSIEFRIKSKKGSIEEIENQILDHSKIYEKNSKIKAEIYKKKDRLRAIEHEEQEKAQEPKKRLQEEIFSCEQKIRSVEREIKFREELISTNKLEIDEFEKKVQNLREKWFKEDKKIFEFDENQCICPTCGQDLPAKNIETKKSELEEKFNSKKKIVLDEITAKGKEISIKINAIKFDNENLHEEVKKLEIEKSKIEKTIVELKKKYEKLTVSEFTETDEYKQIKSEIEKLEVSIVEPDETTIKELKAKKAELEKEIDTLKYQIRSKEHNEKAKKRIADLQARERELANQIAELEGHEFMCEEFIRTKVDLLESRINNKFKQVRFKLFNMLVNGALEECCETLIDGVPYQDANNAGKINAGIDIINTLTKHYNVAAPVFVDNRESVNDLEECDSQVINLVVANTEIIDRLINLPNYTTIKGCNNKILLIKTEKLKAEVA